MIVSQDRGFSLIQVVMGMTLMGITLVGLSHLVKMEGLVRKDVTVYRTMSNLRATFYRTLMKDPEAWSNTIGDANNRLATKGQTDCLVTEETCCQSTSPCNPSNGFLVLKDNDNEIILDSTDATAGFTFDGVACTDFDSALGNYQCPIQIKVSWAAICTGSCFFPTVQVTGDFLFKPGKAYFSSGGKIISLKRYNFKTIRDPDFKKSDVSFGNSVTFIDVSAPIYWNIPAGISTIMIEAWGGGGAGSGGRTPEQTNAPNYMPLSIPVATVGLAQTDPAPRFVFPAGGGGGGGSYVRQFQSGLDDSMILAIYVGRGGQPKIDENDLLPLLAVEVSATNEMAGKGASSRVVLTSNSSEITRAVGGDGGMWCEGDNCQSNLSVTNFYKDIAGNDVYYFHGQGGHGGAPIGPTYFYPGSNGKDYFTNFDERFYPPYYKSYAAETLYLPDTSTLYDDLKYKPGRIFTRYFGGEGGNAGGNGGLGGRNSNHNAELVIPIPASAPGGGGAGSGVGLNGAIDRAQPGARGQVTIWW